MSATNQTVPRTRHEVHDGQIPIGPHTPKINQTLTDLPGFDLRPESSALKECIIWCGPIGDKIFHGLLRAGGCAMTGARDRDRQRRRADRLRRATGPYRTARETLQELHARGDRRPSTIAVRRTLITRHESGGPSPAAQLITPKGLGLALYLTALFEAQCRRPADSQIRNTRSLQPTRTDLGWVDLLPAATTGADTQAAMLRQLQRALTLLERTRLVELPRHGLVGRYERFNVLDESGGGAHGRTGYVVPNRATESASALLRIPVAFFLRGWAHVLLPAEIVVYLIVLDLEGQHGDGGVYLPDRTKDEIYSITRDVYEHHRALRAYGLIDRLADPNRRPDGKFVRRPTLIYDLHPLRFRSARRGLDNDAQPTVIDALLRGW